MRVLTVGELKAALADVDDDIDGLRRAERARDAIGRATTHDRETRCRPTD